MRLKTFLSARSKIALPIISFLFFQQGVFAQSGTVSQPGGGWLWALMGRLHPLTVHFPVALIVFAAVLELFTFHRFNSKLRPGIRLCVLVGAITAVVSVAFGLLLAKDGDYGAGLLSIHQWSGITTAVLSIIAAAVLFRSGDQPSRTAIISYRSLIFLTTAALTVAGHYGASLTHGEDYLTGAINSGSEPKSATPKIDFALFKQDSVHLTPKQEMDLNLQVKAVFAHNCYKCHGSEKIKGDLRLDSKKMIFRGGKSGPLFVAGNPKESEIMRRLQLPRDDKDAMPPKGKTIPEDDIKAIAFWIKQGAPWPDQSNDAKASFRVAKLEPRNPGLPADAQHLGNPVDLWVNEYFKKNKIEWKAVVDDRTYLKRLSLDIIGLLPTPTELDEFEKNKDPNKRSVWARNLLNRNNDYALQWLTFWNDALRNDYSGTGYITHGRYNINKWLFSSLQNNKPYNEFVKELISPDSSSKGFIEGIQWRGVVNASQRTELQAAQNVSQIFLGLNLKCASCHNSFISDWKLDDAYAFANIFSDTSLEINRCDKPTGKYTNARMLWPQLGNIDSSASHAEKQKQLAAIMVRPENGRIYRTIVNRVWAQLMGRGIVEPVDLMDNEPWSQDLLDWLAFNFSGPGKYDLKELIYTITTSKTYQLPSTGLADAMKLTAQNFKFSGMVTRRLTAEQFTDAVGRILTPVFEDSLIQFNPLPAVYTTNQPTPYRSSLVLNNTFLTALGRPNRETVSTSRESQANLIQALELTNGRYFTNALKSGAQKWSKKYPENTELVRQMYLQCLGRLPDDGEIKIALKLLKEPPRNEAVEDLFWAMMLLPEFQLIY